MDESDVRVEVAAPEVCLGADGKDRGEPKEGAAPRARLEPEVLKPWRSLASYF